jgi:hypothetical protein
MRNERNGKNVNARKRDLSGFFLPGALAQPPSLRAPEPPAGLEAFEAFWLGAVVFPVRRELVTKTFYSGPKRSANPDSFLSCLFYRVVTKGRISQPGLMGKTDAVALCSRRSR